MVKLFKFMFYSIVMEYADGGDIFNLIKEHQKSGTLIDEDDIWKIFI